MSRAAALSPDDPPCVHSSANVSAIAAAMSGSASTIATARAAREAAGDRKSPAITSTANPYQQASATFGELGNPIAEKRSQASCPATHSAAAATQQPQR